MRTRNAAPDFDAALAAAIEGEIVSDTGLDDDTDAALIAVARSAPFPPEERIAAARAAFARSADSR